MTDPTLRNARPVLVGLGMMLVAFNMRPALTSLGPLLDAIRAETGLTAAGAAFLTTLPVLCLGLACVLGPVMVRRTGAERGVLVAILVIALGSALRGLGGLPPLFAGACIAAVGIGLAGVLLPGLVKRDFSGQAGLMTRTLHDGSLPRRGDGRRIGGAPGRCLRRLGRVRWRPGPYRPWRRP